MINFLHRKIYFTIRTFFLQELNWCKKQRNRMRTDAAQIIARSFSGDADVDDFPRVEGASSLVTSLVKDISIPQKSPHSPQQSAEVVYRERTAL